MHCYNAVTGSVGSALVVLVQDFYDFLHCRCDIIARDTFYYFCWMMRLDSAVAGPKPG